MIRKLFWLIFLLGGYLWVLTSGHDDFLLAKGKAIYETIVQWVSTAEADFHLKQDKPKQRSRRWE